MALSSLSSVQVPERRRFLRNELPSRVTVNLLQPTRLVPADGVNVSEGGLCLRLQETLEVRSLVDLQLTPDGARHGVEQKPVRCKGRVSWVVQRLDLRPSPPFVFDVGIEFVDPPSMLRKLMVQRGADQAPPPIRQAVRESRLVPSVIRGRQFIPKLERVEDRPPQWHLVVAIDGVPCLSEHYLSKSDAVAGWDRFKRQQARR